MRGTAYAMTEIVVFLAIATLIGITLGWMLARWRGAFRVPAPEAALPVPVEDSGRTRRLEERIQHLETERRILAGSTEELDGLRKELAQAQWQIRTLEDALSGRVSG